jgi:hypothetical protein
MNFSPFLGIFGNMVLVCGLDGTGSSQNNLPSCPVFQRRSSILAHEDEDAQVRNLRGFGPNFNESQEIFEYLRQI